MRQLRLISSILGAALLASIVFGFVLFNHDSKSVADQPQKALVELSDRDFAALQGEVDQRLEAIDSRIDQLEESVSDKVNLLTERIEQLEASRKLASTHDSTFEEKLDEQSDCNKRTAVLIESLQKQLEALTRPKSTTSAVVESTSKTSWQRPYAVQSPQPVQSAKHWTYPGDITTHLQNGHGVDASNLDRESQLSLHDSLHQSTVTSQTGSTVPGVTRTRSYDAQSYSVQSCPGGRCPTSGTASSSGYTFQRSGPVKLFGRFRN